MSELLAHEVVIKDGITANLLTPQIEHLIEELVVGKNEDFLQVERVVLNPYEDCVGLFDMAYSGLIDQGTVDLVEKVLGACGVSKGHIDALIAWYAWRGYYRSLDES